MAILLRAWRASLAGLSGFMVALHFERIGAAEARHRALFVHGILGSGRNWRGFARRLLERCPSWEIVLVDLRHHGESPHPRPPHDLRTVAEDLIDVRSAIGGFEIIVGHSFGGKVALAFADAHPEALRALWVLDSNPGFQHVDMDEPEDHQVLRVVQAVKSHPGPFESRDEAVKTMSAIGFSEGLGRWLVLNLSQTPDGWRWRFDPDVIAEMLASYFATNLWPVLEEVRPFHRHVVYGEKSDRWSVGNLERLESIARVGLIDLHELEDAGHWLHVDNPSGLVELMVPSFDVIGR